MKYKKILAIMLSLGMALSLSACVSASGSVISESSESTSEESTMSESESKIADAALSLIDSKHSDESGKEETVYVISDANGNPQQTIVSAWLKNSDGSDKLADKTNLTDIENTKGDEDYTTDSGENITWNANGSDIYYRGNSTKDAPIDVSIKYELDGKEVDADSLAGADGHLKITFSYKNNTAKQETVNGESVTIYKPYIVISGLMLDDENASNIEVTNGQVVNDGDKSIVVGLAMPGLSDSLGIDELEEEADTTIDFEIPEEVSIEADVTDFSLLTTLTIATDDALDQLGLSDIDDTDELSDKIDELTDGSNKLVSGTDEFAGYMKELNDSTGLLTDGANSLSTNMGTLSSGLETLQSSIQDLPDGTAKLLAGTQALKTALKSCYTGSDISKYGIYEAVNAIAQGASSISSGAEKIMNGAGTAAQAADGIAAGAVSGDTSDAEKYGIYEAADAVESGLKTTIEGLTAKLGEASTNLKTAAGYDETAAGLINGVLNPEDPESAANLTAEQIAALTNAYKAVSGAQQYTSGVQSALEKTSIDISSATTALEGIKTGATSISNYAKQISAGLKSNDTSSSDKYGIYEAAAAIKSGADSLNAAANQIMSSIDTMTNDDNIGALISGLETMSSSSGTLVNAVSQLSSGSSQLTSGSEQLESGINTASEAISELYTASEEIKDGMAQLDSDGIQKIADLVKNDLTSFLNRLKAVNDYAEEAESFSGCPDGVECTTKYIYKTAEISAE